MTYIPAVGARVELIEDYGSKLKGDKGTVLHVGVREGERTLIDVKMDNPRSGGPTISCYTKRLQAETKVLSLGVLPTDAVKLVVQSADRIFPRRSYDTIFKSLMEEMGELATEIAIEQGTKKRQPSIDGVKGEAVDVFIVAVDMLRSAWGDELFTKAFTDKVAAKLAKWEGK